MLFQYVLTQIYLGRSHICILLFLAILGLRKKGLRNAVLTDLKFAAALQHLKPGKAPGPDSICSELILHAGAALKSWLRDFLSSCLRRLKIPKIWRRALVVAIPKPAKPVGDPKSCRPDISALCPLQDPRETYLGPR